MAATVPDLEENDSVSVTYISQRSGGEVTRDGVVDEVMDEDPEPMVFVRVERDGLHERHLVVVPGTDPPVVYGTSVTPDGMDMEDHGDGDRTYHFKRKAERTTLLGELVSVEAEG